MNYYLFLLFTFLTFNSFAAETGTELLSNVNKIIHNINAAQLQQQLKQQPNTVLIDVRTQFEVRQLGTIGAYQNQNIPRGWLEFRIEEAAFNLDTSIVVYCGTNVRSPMAAKTLMDMGYTFTSVRLPFHPTVKLWWSISAPGRNSSTVSRKLRRSCGV